MSLTRAPWLAVITALWPFAGCSLMNLDDFGVRPCATEADCDGARRDFPLPERCGDYHCVDGSCAWQDGRETCNGADDDCNGLIDDGIALSPQILSDADSAATVVAYATAPDASLTYVAAGDTAAQGLVLDGTMSGDATALHYDSMFGTADECPKKNRDGTIGFATCNFKDLALAVDDRHVVYAAVNSFDCSAGQLRIGFADRSAVPFAVWLGARSGASTSNIELGVDVDDETRCTGAAGARSPAIASIDTSPGAAGALAVWLGARLGGGTAARCASVESVPVRALGVFVPSDDEGWLDGTDGGDPRDLGTSTSLGAPAIAALNWPEGSANYAVAFATESEAGRGIALREVGSTDGSLGFSEHFIGDEAPDQIVLASGRRSSAGPELGMAWVSGCGDETALEFARLSEFQGTPTLSAKVSIPIRDLASKPALLHDGNGFSEGSRPGGWYLLWAEQAADAPMRIELARVTDEAVPRLITRVTLSEGGAAFPLLFRSASSPMNHGLLRVGPDGKLKVETSAGICN